MKKNIRHLFFLLGAVFLLAGCANSEAGSGPASFGNSVRQNVAAQVINPDAAAKHRALVYNGERAALAQKKYVSNASEKAEAPKTTLMSGSSGGQ